MTKDIDALVAAADALADLVAEVLADDRLDNFAAQEDALTEYRAAREAVRKGTPPAFATSA